MDLPKSRRIEYLLNMGRLSLEQGNDTKLQDIDKGAIAVF